MPALKLQERAGKQVFWCLPWAGMDPYGEKFPEDTKGVYKVLGSQKYWACGRNAKGFPASLVCFSSSCGERATGRSKDNDDAVLICAPLTLYPALQRAELALGPTSTRLQVLFLHYHLRPARPSGCCLSSDVRVSPCPLPSLKRRDVSALSIWCSQHLDRPCTL